MSTLVLTFGSHSVRICPESTPFSVGRDPDNDFCLDHDVVSGHHGKVIFEEAQFLFIDLSSTNGSFLKSSDGRSTRKTQVLLNGDVSIRLGISGPEIAFAVSFENEDATDGFPLTDQRGIEFLQKGDYRTASGLFEELIRESPNDAAAYYYAGFAASCMENLDSAVLRFEQYLLLRPEDSGALMDLGKIYERKAEFEKARCCYLRVLARNQNEGEAAERIRDIARFHGVHSEAIQRGTKELLGERLLSTIEMPPFRISYDLAYHGRILTDVVKCLKVAFEEVGRTLDHYPQETIQVSLEPPLGDVSGLTGPKGLLLRVDQEHLGERAFLTVLVTHEYGHYLLGEKTRFSTSVPWWLHEGFAQHVSQNLTATRLFHISHISRTGRLIPLKALETGLGDIKDRDVVQAANIEAHAAVSFLVKKKGNEGLRELIGSLAIRKTMGEALERLGWSHEAFEQEWSHWLAETAASGMVKLTREIGENIKEDRKLKS